MQARSADPEAEWPRNGGERGGWGEISVEMWLFLLVLSQTAAVRLPWTGIEPGLPSLPILRSEPRSGDDRVGDQRRFCNIVGGVMIPPWGVPSVVANQVCFSRKPAFNHFASTCRSMGTWVRSHSWL